MTRQFSRRCFQQLEPDREDSDREDDDDEEEEPNDDPYTTATSSTTSQTGTDTACLDSGEPGWLAEPASKAVGSKGTGRRQARKAEENMDWKNRAWQLCLHHARRMGCGEPTNNNLELACKAWCGKTDSEAGHAVHVTDNYATWQEATLSHQTVAHISPLDYTRFFRSIEAHTRKVWPVIERKTLVSRSRAQYRGECKGGGGSAIARWWRTAKVWAQTVDKWTTTKGKRQGGSTPASSP